jgi:hypothetical protein
MAEEPFYSPSYKPKPRQPLPGELLLAFSRVSDKTVWRCELRDKGEYGVDCQWYLDGSFHLSRLWPTRELAIAWATEERNAFERGSE